MVKWSKREQITRVLWALAHPLFVLSPRPLWAWRRMLLRLFGATIEDKVHVYPSVKITIPWNIHLKRGAAIGDNAILYALGRIQVGEGAVISQFAHLCAGTHSYRDPRMPLEKRPIVIGPGAWVCADAFIGPGVTVGAGAIAGARAVVMKDVGENSIVAGNPAKIVGRR
ncbi:colanic acid biosynthesis acetyltransferase WcaF [Mesorhizobium mediterraneum]|uniref:colanic acid biosynthesis acetyltransferase WcaF n=1 Tax=Mesorhizobium mediterraneum TaxID=43617 RepID=UPI001AEDB659|nr:colanic acid biosynthesis acetyltransferase WcaF [Mesorhizobium mediterraneum]